MVNTPSIQQLQEIKQRRDIDDKVNNAHAMKEADILPILMKYFKVYRGKDQNYKNIFYCCDELVEKLNEETT